MRRQDQPVARQQRIVGRRRLRDLHVERGALDAAAVERIQQRRLVDDAAARAVDDVGRRLHQGQLRRTDQVARVVLQRAMHGHEVGARQGGAEVGHRLAAHGLDLSRRIGRIDAQALEPQRVQRLRQPAADAPEPDDEHRPSGNVHGDELRPAAPVVALAHGAVELVQPLGQRVHHGDGVLHHRRRIGEADGGHDHAPLGRRRHVDVVEADAVARDDLEVGRRLHHGARDLGEAHADRLGARQEVGPRRRVGRLRAR